MTESQGQFAVHQDLAWRGRVNFIIHAQFPRQLPRALALPGGDEQKRRVLRFVGPFGMCSDLLRTGSPFLDAGNCETEPDQQVEIAREVRCCLMTPFASQSVERGPSLR